MNLIMTGTQEGTVGADFCWGKSWSFQAQFEQKQWSFMGHVIFKLESSKIILDKFSRLKKYLKKYSW
jgi:hypothetical protein